MMVGIFALPNGGPRLDPTPAPKPVRFQPGDWVAWIPDGDEGVVCGVITGQAIAIRWASTGGIEVYSIYSGAMERIAPHEVQTADEIPPF